MCIEDYLTNKLSETALYKVTFKVILLKPSFSRTGVAFEYSLF
jgi:hypothetical protein